MKGRLIVFCVLLLAGCSRKPPPAPLPPPPANPPTSARTPDELQKVVECAIRVTRDPRSRSGLACWTCYQRLREALKGIRGVTEVKVYPDGGFVVARYRTDELSDAGRLTAAIGENMPGAETERLEEVPVIPRRIRLTKDVPRPVKAALNQATAQQPLIVVKCVAAACERCKAPEPGWGDRVIRIEVDLDETVGALAWLAPEAVPEWVCFDRRGNELGRWRGGIELTTFEERLRDLLGRAE